jgi:hypothetical protein
MIIFRRSLILRFAHFAQSLESVLPEHVSEESGALSPTFSGSDAFGEIDGSTFLKQIRFSVARIVWVRETEEHQKRIFVIPGLTVAS